MLHVQVYKDFDRTNENTISVCVLPVGFTQHQSRVDRVEVPLYLSTGRLKENQKTKNDEDEVYTKKIAIWLQVEFKKTEALLPLL